MQSCFNLWLSVSVIKSRNNIQKERYEDEIKNNRDAAWQDEDARQEHRSGRADMQECHPWHQLYGLRTDDTQASLGAWRSDGKGLTT